MKSGKPGCFLTPPFCPRSKCETRNHNSTNSKSWADKNQLHSPQSLFFKKWRLRRRELNKMGAAGADQQTKTRGCVPLSTFTVNIALHLMCKCRGESAVPHQWNHLPLPNEPPLVHSQPLKENDPTTYFPLWQEAGFVKDKESSLVKQAFRTLSLSDESHAFGSICSLHTYL